MCISPKLPENMTPSECWVVLLNESDEGAEIPLPVGLVHALYLAATLQVGLALEARKILLLFQSKELIAMYTAVQMIAFLLKEHQM